MCTGRVFRCACIMLGVVSIAALENYFRHIEKLVTQCWGLANMSRRSENISS